MAWVIDPVHSEINFSARHMMISTVRGRFEKFSGTVNFDEAAPARTTDSSEGRFVAPGFIDAHVHLESAMVTPAPSWSFSTGRLINTSQRRVRIFDSRLPTLP